MADVAQLVEPRFVVPVVVSSSLIVRPIKKACILQAFFAKHNQCPFVTCLGLKFISPFLKSCCVGFFGSCTTSFAGILE